MPIKRLFSNRFLDFLAFFEEKDMVGGEGIEPPTLSV